MLGFKGSDPIRRILREHLDRSAAAYGILAVALLLTVLAFFYVRQNVEARERESFDETVQAVQRSVDRRMDTYVDAMLEGRGLFAASKAVTRDEWHRYVTTTALERRYPGIRAVGYAPRVTLAGKGAYVSRVREEGLPDYGVRPSGERYEYYPVKFIEPFEGANQSLAGKDFYADPVSRSAMEQARDTALPRTSGKVELSGDTGSGDRSGFLVYTPVYKTGAPSEDVQERRRALEGFIVGVFDTRDLLTGIFGEKVAPQVDFEIFDGAEFSGEQLLYDDDRKMRAGDSSYSPRFQDITTVNVAGRVWTLHFSTMPGFASGWRSNLDLLVLLSGLAISLVLFGVTWMLSKNRLLAEQVGADLEAVNRELATANRDLESANRELAATNKELKSFSYSVSHDLRAPLRSIEGFAQILLDDYSSALDEEGRGYLSRVRSASQHMGQLIDDLLNLSRVTRVPLRRETVDLSIIASEIVSELRQSDPERRAEFAVLEGLVANADSRLLRVALENLLNNAWKFTSKKPQARIEFGAVTLNGVLAYYVRDNGAGFEMAYANQLFGAFQRLHGPDEFEGTGIGLATVQRIVHRHGGRVWAQSKVGEGATFYFTLPQ